ncbi:MAG TPA: alpha/beta fold hydrolase [Umezawaea sp.]|nr:alpha/beta fold hydrolase [Umezawaea sp.]
MPALHRGSLAADTLAVQAAVDALPTPPIALGHSYGGSVITGLTGVAALVYVAAFVPDEGESAATLGGATALLRAAVRQTPDGTTSIDPHLATDLFYADCAPDVATRATALLRPQAPAAAEECPSGRRGGTSRRPTWSARAIKPSTPSCSASWRPGARPRSNGRPATRRTCPSPPN